MYWTRKNQKRKSHIPITMPHIKVSYEDMDKLIELIKLSPALYDPKHRDYKDSMHLEATWNQIALEMGRTDMTSADWRKKWVNRRDTYVKKKRQIRNYSHSPMMVEQAKRWRYFYTMTFLDGFDEGGCNENSEHNFMITTNEDDSSEGMSCDDDIDESLSVSVCPKVESTAKKRAASTTLTQQTMTKRKSESGGASSSSNRGQSPSISFNNATEDNLTARQQDSSSAGLIHTHTPAAGGFRVDHDHPPAMPSPRFPSSYTSHSHSHHQHRSSPVPAHHNIPTRVESPEYNLLLQAYAHRLERLPEQTRSFLQLQMAQLFFNAENPDLPHVPIMQLPKYIPPVPSSSLSLSHSSSSGSGRKQRQHNGLEEEVPRYLHRQQRQQHQLSHQEQQLSAEQLSSDQDEHREELVNGETTTSIKIERI